MTDQSVTSGGGQGKVTTVFPVIPSTIELYDLLMKDIEPELMSRSVPSLATKYRRETKEEATIRAARYAKAFQEYERRLEAYIGELNASIRKFGRDAALSFEALERSMTNTSLDSPEIPTSNS
jgi:hypothetical protein